VAGKNERQRRQAREKHRRQQEIRVARQRVVRNRWLTGISVIAAAGLIVGLVVAFLPGNAKKPSASASKKASASASASASATASAATVAEPAHHCSYTSASPVAKKVSFPPTTPDYTAGYVATINTNLGPITLNLLNSKATCTVNSFVHLAEAGYFNNTQCHRLTTTGIYVLQCGDAFATASTKMTCSTTGDIGTGTPGYEFASENLTKATYPAGTVAMANDGTADTNGSQFFLVYKDSTSGLNGTGSPSYTPFATVSSGLGIVQNVAKDGFACQYIEQGQSEGGAPKDKVVIDSVTIKKT
jgi:peptidyl-prolyl cis-trans isomerase B (cyclophilin B)